MAKNQHKKVAPVGGYAGCRGYENNGAVLSISTGSVQTSDALPYDLIDIASTQTCFITIGPLASVADPTAAAGYVILAGIPYRLPIEKGDAIKVLGSDATPSAFYIHPVKGDLDDEV